ncbi:CynX/NimT family MFS transporter [Desulfitobacterium sp. PCE1]|uniref:MFS transporter n=1 Tax=Desulfitobacterium sp. PCE1 TaxID=146907 RepID=UPI00036781F0|nr:MFS transporter [Desulfitobacterium sp. PCE1]
MTSEQTGKYQNYLLVAIMFVLTAAVVAANQFKVPTIMNDVAAAFNMSESQAPWLMSIFTMVGIFLAIPTGGMAQKFGPKIMVVAAAIFIGVGSLIGSIASGANMLIFSRGIEGVGFIFAAVCGPLAITRYVEPSKVGFAIGIWTTWVSLGQISAFSITPVMFGSMSLSSIWMFYGAIALVMAVLLQFVIRGNTGTIVTNDGPKVKFSALFGKKNLWLLCLGFVTFNIVFMSGLAFAPAYLESSGMMTKSQAGFALTIPMIISIFSCPFFGKLSDMMGGGHKKLLLIALIVLGPSIALLFNTSTTLVYLGGILFGAIGMGVPPMVVGSIGEVAENPELIGPAMGLLMTLQNLGMFLGTLIFMPIVGLVGGSFTTAGLVLIPIALIGVILTAMAKFK